MSPQSKENISRENYSSFTKTKTVTEMVSSKTTKKTKTTVQSLDNVKTFLGYHFFSADCRRNWTNLNKTSTKLKTFHKLRSSSQTATTMITSKQQQQEETFTQERHKQQQQVTERAQNIPLLSESSTATFTKKIKQERQQQYEEGQQKSNNGINETRNNKILWSMLDSGLHLRVHRLCQASAKLENKGKELVQCKIQKLWKFCSEVCRRIGDCKTWNKGGKFPFCKIYILHSLPFHRSVLHNLSAFHLFSFAKIPSSLNWLGCLGLFPSQLFVTNCTFLTRTAPPL